MHVVLGRTNRDAKPSRDVLVGRPIEDQSGDFAASRRQPVEADRRSRWMGHENRRPKRRRCREVNRHAQPAPRQPLERCNGLPGSGAARLAQTFESEAKFVDHILLEHFNPGVPMTSLPTEISNFFLAMQAGAAGGRSMEGLFAAKAIYEEPFSGSVQRHEGADAILTTMRQGWSYNPPDIHIAIE